MTLRPSSWKTALPPPVLVLALAWAVGAWHGWAWPQTWRATQWAALALLLLALALMIWAASVMRRHRTTLNPMNPNEAAHLVESGPFACSRNPIYLADVLMLVAWCLWLEVDAPGWLAPLLAWLWLDRLQIRSEETALRQHFGAAYDAYCQRVCRWLGRRD